MTFGDQRVEAGIHSQFGIVSVCPRADGDGFFSRIGSAVLRRKRPLQDKFAHALHSSVHEREMICDHGSAVRGSMTSPDVRHQPENPHSGWSKDGGKRSDERTLLGAG
jgi:hypothetical protein